MIGVVLTLVLIGVVLYLLALIPMDAAIRQLIRVVVIVAVVLWLLGVFGVTSWDVPVPRWR